MIKKEKLLKYAKIAFLIIYILFSIGLCLTPLKYYHSLDFILLYFGIILIFALVLKFRKFIANQLQKLTIGNLIFIYFICLGVILRIFLIFFDYNELVGVGDYQTFLHNASEFCNTNTIPQKTYVELFPFLIPYMTILGTFFKLTTISYQNIVLLNVILDLFIPIFLYFTFNNKNIAKCVAIIWFLNPINLIWCMVCCPVVLVNFGIALSILMFSILLKNISSKKFILYSLLTGLIIGIANSFRPLMIIMIIAIALYYIFINLEEKNFNVNYIISFVIIILSFLIIKNFTTIILNKIIDGNVSTSSGWTLYIGSNLESNGMWYAEPKLDEFLGNNLTAEETHQEFKKLAIERYKNNGIQNIKLFFAKFFVITGQVSEYTFGTFNSVLTINNNFLLKILKIILHIYFYLLLLLNLLFSIKSFNNRKHCKKIIFYMLLFIGIVLAHLFVEVSPRYYMPAMIPLSIIAGFSIYKIFNKTQEENL